MHKLILYVLISIFCMLLIALQIDEESAMNGVFRLKHGVNRAVHAAAGQLDLERLAQGVMWIDESAAEREALHYLRENLLLDGELKPLSGSFLKDPVEILVLDVINADQTFPYLYRNEQYHYEITLRRPGVVMIIQAEYPRIFRIIEPITWRVEGTAEHFMTSK